MKTTQSIQWMAALGLALAAACLAPSAGAQTFTDNIAIASHYATLQATPM